MGTVCAGDVRHDRDGPVPKDGMGGADEKK